MLIISRYYKGLDLSEDIQCMYELILKVEDSNIRNQLQTQLSNISDAIDKKGKIIKDAIKKLEEL